MSAPLTSEELDAIEARARAATQGDWFNQDGPFVEHPDGTRDIARCNCGHQSYRAAAEEEAANAARIAGLDPPTALRLVAMARGELAKAAACKESLQGDIP